MNTCAKCGERRGVNPIGLGEWLCNRCHFTTRAARKSRAKTRNVEQVPAIEVLKRWADMGFSAVEISEHVGLKNHHRVMQRVKNGEDQRLTDEAIANIMAKADSYPIRKPHPKTVERLARVSRPRPPRPPRPVKVKAETEPKREKKRKEPPPKEPEPFLAHVPGLRERLKNQRKAQRGF